MEATDNVGMQYVYIHLTALSFSLLISSDLITYFNWFLIVEATDNELSPRSCQGI